MIDDNKVPTLEQTIQRITGDLMAMSTALHAVIASHPAPSTLRKQMRMYADETTPIFVLPTLFARDDGMRETYSNTLRSLIAAIPPD